MAEEDLTLSMRERGSRRVKRALDDVGDSVRDVGRSSRRANKSVGIFSRAFTLLRTRALMVAMAIGLVSLAALASLPALAALVAAMVALGGLMLPVFALGAGVAMIYKDTVEMAGSSAAKLRDMLAHLKTAFRVTVAPGAALVMQGITAAIETLLPLLESLRPAFTIFGRVAGDAIQAAAAGLATMGPEIAAMMAAAGPLLMTLGQGLPVIMGAFIQLATIGMPILNQILIWLIDFIAWLGPAIASAISFRDVSDYLVGVFTNLWGILTQLWPIFEPLAAFLGGALLMAAQAFGDALEWLNQNLGGMMPYLAPIVAVLLGMAVAWGVASAAIAIATAALAAWNFVMSITTLGWIVLAVGALAAGLIYAWHNSETFRNVVTAAFDAVKTAAGWLWEKLKQVFDLMVQIGKWTPGGIVLRGLKWGAEKLGVPLPFAAGGTTPGGPVLVGERGPEIVSPPRGSVVTPNHALGGGEIVVPVTLVMPDGQVLARTSVRAARRAKSVR